MASTMMSILESSAILTDNLCTTLVSGVLKELTSATRVTIKKRALVEKMTETVSILRSFVDKVTDNQVRFSEDEDMQLWVRDLQEAVFDADNVIDVLLTQIELKEVRRSSLLSKLDQIWTVLDRVISIILRLKFASTDPTTNPVWARREEAIRCDIDDTIVGREEDVKAVVDRLLNDNSNDLDHCCLAIVGVTGIGKSTLAKLVYNDARIRHEFPSARYWVSAFDVCGNSEATLRKITESPYEDHYHAMFAGKRFLLVLDDMRIDDMFPDIRKMLSKLFRIGASGSRIMITSQSPFDTSNWPSDYVVAYVLKDLTEENSRRLFEMIAFDTHPSPPPVPQPEFVEVCNAILENCNHPLTIKLIAGFLYGQDISLWKLFLQVIKTEGVSVSSILSLSYNCLSYRLKACFRYCALFPRQFVIYKKMLIRLWMAQGMKDFGEKYFSTLIRRGFFQVVERDVFGDIVSFRICQQIHAFAEEATKDEMFRVRPFETHETWRGVCHLFQYADQAYYAMEEQMSVGYTTTIRSYLQRGLRLFSVVEKLVTRCKSLRTLDLHGSKLKHLPDSIGDLSHLRYLDLSLNRYLETLPDSIVKLHHLQTLDLRYCALLKELPQGFSMLAKLRWLDTFGCDGLTHMPSGMDKFTCLQLLSQFVVAEGRSSKKQPNAELRDLTKLVNLRGSICILIPRSYTIAKRGACLEAMEHLDEVLVHFLEPLYVDLYDRRVVSYHQTLLEKLMPHPNVKVLMLWGYQGSVIPMWGRKEDNWGNSLPNLVKIELRSCGRLQELPLLRELEHLKSLKLYGLRELEFLEDAHTSSSVTHPESKFFPSLEKLEIHNAPKLIGLWNGLTDFPSRLVRIELRSCKRLSKLPSLSNLSFLKSLKLYDISSLEVLGSFPTSPMTFETEFIHSLEELEIVNAPKLEWCWMLDLKSFVPNNRIASPLSFPSLKSMTLANLPKLKGFISQQGGTSDADVQVYDRILLEMGSLSELRVSYCPYLKHMPTTPALKTLEAIHVLEELMVEILKDRYLRLGERRAPCSLPSFTYAYRNVIFKSENDHTDTESYLKIEECGNLDIKKSIDVYAKKLVLRGYSLPRLLSCCSTMIDFDCLKELEIEDGGNYIQDIDFLRSLKDLRVLKLTNISNLGSLSAFLGTRVEEISLSWLYNLQVLPEEIALLSHLRLLSIRSCPNLTRLPDLLGGLSSLEHLVIEDCSRLKELPRSLHENEFIRVVIHNCPLL